MTSCEHLGTIDCTGDSAYFAKQLLTWQPEHDKKRKAWTVPYPASFFETVREFQRRLGAAGGYVFPRQEGSNDYAPRELVSQWIRKAEVAAELPKMPGGTCHPYRRKWRSERRHLPIKAVAIETDDQESG